jgi:hypothetical protein
MAARLKIEKRGDEIKKKIFSSETCATIMVRGQDYQTQFWKRTIQ